MKISNSTNEPIKDKKGMRWYTEVGGQHKNGSCLSSTQESGVEWNEWTHAPGWIWKSCSEGDRWHDMRNEVMDGIKTEIADNMEN